MINLPMPGADAVSAAGRTQFGAMLRRDILKA
jgi:hypothetical protein